MKGFSLKKWIEDCRNYYGNDPASQDRDNKFFKKELGNVISSGKDLSDLSKEKIVELKREFHTIQNSLNVEYLIPQENESLFILNNVDSQQYKVPNEYELMNLLSAFAVGYGLADQNAKDNAVLCNKIINTFVSEGYNIYPLMKKLNIRTQEIVDGTEYLLNKEQKSHQFQVCHTGNKLLENAQQLSPYKEVFELSDKIGELMAQQEYEGKDVQKDIDELKVKLDEMVSDFDPYFLETCANDRVGYLETFSEERFYGYGLEALSDSVRKLETTQTQHTTNQNTNINENIK